MKRIALLFLLAVVAPSAPVEVAFSIDSNVARVMTAEERAEFGVGAWKPATRARFEAWLRAYALGNANALLAAANKAGE